LRFAFLTSTPLNILNGSGTFAGIDALVESLRELGHQVEVLTPNFPCFHYTTRRLIYNRLLGSRIDALDPDIVIGFDMDGYLYSSRAVSGKSRAPFVADRKSVV